MKAWFIIKDGKIINSITGYTSEEGALKSLAKLSNPDYNNLVKNIYPHRIDSKISNEKKKYYNQCFDYDGNKVFIRNVTDDSTEFRKNVIYPYLKEYYQIVEKEFEIVFKN